MFTVMRANELNKPTVPIVYVLQTLQLAADRGVSREAMLKGTKLATELLEQADARLGLLEYGHLCVRALQLTRDPALGYAFGLRSHLTAHGLFGLGMMCQPTLAEAIGFAGRYFGPLRMPGWDIRLVVEDEHAVIHLFETVPYGLLRQYALDMALVSLTTTLRPLLPPQPEIELWFDCEQPDYYPRYRDQLPPCHFAMGANQFRFPAAYLSLSLATANAVTARLVARECERELALIGHTEDLLERVRVVLQNERNNYPTLETVATRLYMTSRTLKRRLNAHGMHFRQLLDEARRRDSIRLLKDPTLSLDEVAHRLGYSAPANFSRAFRKWTGTTPGAFRGS